MTGALPTPHDAAGTPVVTFTPVVLPVPGRPVDLTLRVSAPATGENLPIVLLSHGHGPSHYVSSLYGYGPLVDYYAAHGFVVIQPTHLDSATLGLREAAHPEAPLYWRERVLDMTRILDRLDVIEATVPGLRGRLDTDRIAVVGHSMGGHTASLLLGVGLTDPSDGTVVDLSDARITTGVLMAAPGRGGDALSEFAAEHYPFFSRPDFSTMSVPVLVVAGENDDVPYLTVSGPQWSRDPFDLSPGPKALLSVVDAEHGLGGVAGYDLQETTDENPARVAMVQRLTSAYLRSQLSGDSTAWAGAVETLSRTEKPLAHVESK